MVSMVSSTVSARNPKSTPNPQGFSAHAFEFANERKMKRATMANMIFNHLSIILAVFLFSAGVDLNVNVQERKEHTFFVRINSLLEADSIPYEATMLIIIPTIKNAE